MFNESFWVAVAIVIFVALVFKRVKAAMDEFLDSRSASIKHRIEEVISLCNEAEKLLQEQRDLHEKSAEVIASSLVATEKEVKQIKDNATKELANKLTQKTSSVMNRIHGDEAKLLIKLRLKAVKLAISTSMIILNSHGSDKVNSNLLDESLDAMSTKFSQISL